MELIYNRLFVGSSSFSIIFFLCYTHPFSVAIPMHLVAGKTDSYMENSSTQYTHDRWNRLKLDFVSLSLVLHVFYVVCVAKIISQLK